MDAREVYARHAEQYDELVRAEDVDGNLLPALRELCPLEGARVVEVGAGTGRLTRLLLEGGAHVDATEGSAAMLEIARRGLGDDPRLTLQVADARALPCPEARADVGIAGWVFGHLRHWMPQGWRDEIGKALDELARVVRPGGTLVVIETLGTTYTEPAPPNPALAEYYAWLEQDRGFARTAIRTDYHFASVDDASRVLGFFFGEDKAAWPRDHGTPRIPECTGIWSRRR